MTKEEIKQWIRNLIDYSLKTQNEYHKNIFELCYNKSYLRALKFSKITGNIVNKENFKGGEQLFGFDAKYNKIWHYSKIRVYLEENYLKDYIEHIEILKEVLNEYEEYKGYNVR